MKYLILILTLAVSSCCVPAHLRKPVYMSPKNTSAQKFFYPQTLSYPETTYYQEGKYIKLNNNN